MNFNFHPPLASFPVALIIVVLLLEIASLFFKSDFIKKAIAVNISFAAFFVILTFFSGYQAMELAKVEHPEQQDLVAYHHNLGRLLLFSMLACFFSYIAAVKAKRNQRYFYIGYFLLLVLCSLLVIFTGYTGGDLVFGHSIGIH